MPQADLKKAVKTVREKLADVKADFEGVRQEIKETTTTLLPGRLGLVRERIAQRRDFIKKRLEQKTA